jgi:hypothetical protein
MLAVRRGAGPRATAPESPHVHTSKRIQSRSTQAGVRVRWRQREAAERFAERRRREDESPRLLALVPKLLTLKFRLEERRATSSITETAHVRPIVVSNAPALFVFPCQNSACEHGGHDVTAAICAFLRAGREHMEGEDACRGQTGNADCGRILRYIVTATYAV